MTYEYIDFAPCTNITFFAASGGELNPKRFKRFAPNVTLKDVIANEEFSFPPVNTDSAEGAYEKVLEYGGCSLVRDAHDLRYVDNVKNRSYSYESSAGSSKGLIDSQSNVDGWPEYKIYNSYIDSDADGIPDGWLAKNFPGKKATEQNSEGYTCLEVYLNSLVAHLFEDGFSEGEEKKSLHTTSCN